MVGPLDRGQQDTATHREQEDVQQEPDTGPDPTPALPVRHEAGQLGPLDERGDVPFGHLTRASVGGLQEIDQLAIMRGCTKWSDRVHNLARIPEMVNTAFQAKAPNATPAPPAVAASSSGSDKPR